MKLYEIAAQYNALLEMADDESIPPELIADTLEDIQGAFEEKADNIACVIKSVRAAAEAIRKEANELNLRLKRKEKIAESLTEYLKAQLEAVGKTKVETARNMISVAKKPASVEIENPEDFILWAEKHHEEYVRYKSPEINKTAVRDALKAGSELPGAKLVTDTRLVVR